MEIIAGKKYVTRSGDIARIIPSTPEVEDCYPIWGFVGDTELTWCANGRYYAGEDHEESMYDLVAPCEPEPAPFVVDARATMAIHFLAAMIGNDGKGDGTRGARGVVVLAGYAVEYADALIAELAKGKTE